MNDLYIKVYADFQERMQEEIEFESDEGAEIETRLNLEALEDALANPVILRFIQELTHSAIDVGRKITAEAD